MLSFIVSLKKIYIYEYFGFSQLLSAFYIQVRTESIWQLYRNVATETPATKLLVSITVLFRIDGFGAVVCGSYMPPIYYMLPLSNT